MAPPLATPAGSRRWNTSWGHVLRTEGGEKTPLFASQLLENLRADGVPVPLPIRTPYVNTIPVSLCW